MKINRSPGYIAYIQSTAWRARSKACIESADRVCQKCKSCKATQSHHLTYVRFTNELPEDLLAVCGACHRAIHVLVPKKVKEVPARKALTRRQEKQRAKLVREHNAEIIARNKAERIARNKKQ